MHFSFSLRAAPVILRLSFFFNDTATTEIYTLSLHDALPIWQCGCDFLMHWDRQRGNGLRLRSEEHTSELQSHLNLVCRLLLEKKKTHFDELVRALTPDTYVSVSACMVPAVD